MVLSHGAPLRRRVERRFPALSSLRGHKPAQDSKCPSLGKRLMSVPISETIARALSEAMPGAVLTRSTAMRKGSSWPQFRSRSLQSPRRDDRSASDEVSAENDVAA